MDTNSEILELRLCESQNLILKANQLYRFTVDENCKRCVELHNQYPIQKGDRVRYKGGWGAARVMELNTATGIAKLNRFIMDRKHWNVSELERV